MKEVTFLSHVLDTNTVGFAGKNTFSVEKATAICCGDSSNSAYWKFHNHIGTHIDLPKHFIEDGKTIDQTPAAYWIFNKVFLNTFDSIRENEIITYGSWCDKIPKDCELLLLKTGFEKYRDQEKYWKFNPAFSTDLAFWLKRNRPLIRCIGFDTLSLTGYQHRELGRKAHKAFLSSETENEHEIFIIEDMHLSSIFTSPDKVIVLPLIVRNADASPCSILGIFSSTRN